MVERRRYITFLLGLFAFMIGIGLIIGSYYAWDWFMKMWGHINMVVLLGRNGDRILNAIVGFAFFVIGILMMIGVLKP